MSLSVGKCPTFAAIMLELDEEQKFPQKNTNNRSLKTLTQNICVSVKIILVAMTICMYRKTVASKNTLILKHQ
jgi:hypothetical protein